MRADGQPGADSTALTARKNPGRKRVLLLGGGFGGMYTALHLERDLARDADVQVTLVSRHNYFLFTPMLHEVAASDLDPNAIVVFLRKELPHVELFSGDVTGIDLEARKVSVVHGGVDGHEHALDYDYLVMGMGSETSFFNMKGPRDHSLTMKTLGDAILLRHRLIARLEEAAADCIIHSDRSPIVTFVVVGGGFAGVEAAGAINDFIHGALPYYHRIQPAHVRVILVHGGKEVLPELGPDLGAYARRKLIEHGVEVILDTHVVDVSADSVTLEGGRTIPSRTVLWTAGVAPPSIIQSLPCEKTKGRIRVNERLEVPGFPGVWALGDCAAVPDAFTGGASPPTAQHALRQARTVACNVEAALRGGKPRAFRYKMMGQLAAIGRRAGVASVFGLKFSGFVAWFLWRTVYLWKLPRLEKKVRVALDWTLDLLFKKDLVQFISAREVDQFSRLLIPPPEERDATAKQLVGLEQQLH